MQATQQPQPGLLPQPAQPAQLPQPAQPAQLPQPAQPVAPGTPDRYVYTTHQLSGPAAVLAAARAAREELGNQLERLEERRSELAQGLRRGAEGMNRDGIERRIASIDQRIVEVEKQIAAADELVARSAAVPGATIEPPEPPPLPDPDAAMQTAAIVSTVFTMFVLFPISIAYSRRLWRRGAVAVAELPKVLAERLNRIDQAVDAIAIEVERVSEGQRFLTKVMTDGAGRAIGAGPAQPVEAKRTSD